MLCSKESRDDVTSIRPEGVWIEIADWHLEITRTSIRHLPKDNWALLSSKNCLATTISSTLIYQTRIRVRRAKRDLLSFLSRHLASRLGRSHFGNQIGSTPFRRTKLFWNRTRGGNRGPYCTQLGIVVTVTGLSDIAKQMIYQISS